MANIANLITKLSGIIASLDDIRDAISQGGGGSSTASGVTVTPVSPLTGTNLQATTNETAALLQDHADEISALNSSISVLLWANASPSSGMVASSISLASSDYDYLKVFYVSTKDDLRFTHSEELLKGKSCTLSDFFFSGGSTPIMRSRDLAYSSDTTYTVTGGNVATQGTGITANTGVCVPIAIYGCKFAS